MFVGVDTSNEQDYTSILLCSKKVTNGFDVEFVPLRLTKGQINELEFDEFEEVK